MSCEWSVVFGGLRCNGEGGWWSFVWVSARSGRVDVIGGQRMARKRESVAEREARERLRDRYDAEVRAVAEFFGYAGQIDRLNAKIDVLAERQVETVAWLAESTGVSRVADTVCWSVNKVRDAVAKTRREVGGSSSVAATPDAGS